MKDNLHVCEVCKLLDNDLTEKPCTYCSVCKVYLCNTDLKDMTRRAKAMLKKAQQSFGL